MTLPSVGRIVHLNGHRVNSDEPACVPAIVTEVDGNYVYARAFASPRTWVSAVEPYDERQWHWPERV